MKKRHTWTEENTEFLRTHYKKSNEWLCEQLNCGKRTISKYRSLLALPRPNDYRRKYKERNQADKFKLGWTIGLFATDGCLQTNRRNRSPVERVSLQLSSKDTNTVETFFDILLEGFCMEDITQKVASNSYSDQPRASYVCAMPKFISTVREYLQFERKTYDMELTDRFFLESEDFKLGFLRGAIDGDGHVSIPSGAVSITSASYKFLEGLQKEFTGRISKRNYGNYWDLRFRTWEIGELKERGLLLNVEIPMKRKTIRLLESGRQ